MRLGYRFEYVLSNDIGFISFLVMYVNGRKVLDSYYEGADILEDDGGDWITSLAIQFMKSIEAISDDPRTYSYIHFLELYGCKDLEISLKSENLVSISFVDEGINCPSFDQKKTKLKYYWENERISYECYYNAVEEYCSKTQNKYMSYEADILDYEYSEFNEYYNKLFVDIKR